MKKTVTRALAFILLVILLVSAPVFTVPGLALETNYFLSKSDRPAPVSNNENYFLNFINNKRAGAGLAPLTICPYLSEIARKYSAQFNYDIQWPDDDPNLTHLKKMVPDYGATDANLSFQYIASPSLEKAQAVLNSPESAGYLLNKEYNFIGIGVAEVFNPHIYFITLIPLERKVTLNKFPRTVNPGQTEKLSGYLNKDYKNPIIKMTLPNGQVKTFSVFENMSGYFESEIKFDKGPGDYSLEIIVQNRYGPSIAHILPVIVGFSSSHPLPAGSGESSDLSQSPETLEKKLFDLVNDTRRSNNLRVLEENPEIASIARSHSQAMFREQKAAHILSDGLSIKERLQNKQIFQAAAGENIAANSSVNSAHQSLLDSPAHREAILNGEYTHLGVGLVKDTPNQLLYITEVFIKEMPRVGADEAGNKIFALVNGARLQNGFNELRLNQKLVEIAKEHSELMAREDKVQNIPNFGQLLKDKKIKYFAAYTEVMRTTKIEDVLNLKIINNVKGLRYLGVGTVQSRTSAYGSGALYITLIFLK